MNPLDVTLTEEQLIAMGFCIDKTPKGKIRSICLDVQKCGWSMDEKLPSFYKLPTWRTLFEEIYDLGIEHAKQQLSKNLTNLLSGAN